METEKIKTIALILIATLLGVACFFAIEDYYASKQEETFQFGKQEGALMQIDFQTKNKVCQLFVRDEAGNLTIQNFEVTNG